MVTRQYAWYMLAILTAINFVNYVDRQVIISLGPFIQDDLALSNFQFGLLGTAFMLIHSLVTVPFGILSDRWLRHKIVALGVLFWSAATLLPVLPRCLYDVVNTEQHARSLDGGFECLNLHGLRKQTNYR